jgi:hypothetical protein
VLRRWLDRGARVTVAEVTGLWIISAGLIIALALVGCPITVTGGMALGVVTVSIAWELLTGRRECRAPVTLRATGRWTKQELAALDDARGLARLLDALPEARRERTLP